MLPSSNLLYQNFSKRLCIEIQWMCFCRGLCKSPSISKYHRRLDRIGSFRHLHCTTGEGNMRATGDSFLTLPQKEGSQAGIALLDHLYSIVSSQVRHIHPRRRHHPLSHHRPVQGQGLLQNRRQLAAEWFSPS